MIAKAKSSHIRMSPVKLRQVINLIRGKDIRSASNILLHADKGCTQTVGKILNSAVNNAKQKGLTEDQLFISKIFADQGPSWKRWRAASFGRASPILKKTAHLTIELDLMGASNVPVVNQEAVAVAEAQQISKPAKKASEPKKKTSQAKTTKKLVPSS